MQLLAQATSNPNPLSLILSAIAVVIALAALLHNRANSIDAVRPELVLDGWGCNQPRGPQSIGLGLGSRVLRA